MCVFIINRFDCIIVGDMSDGIAVKCWWCSRPSTTSTATRIPTTGYPRWNMHGYFCCVPCAKAYATEKGSSCHYLKIYLQKTRGIPYATPLPTAPPWRCLDEFSPDFGMSRTAFHNDSHRWQISMHGDTAYGKPLKAMICPHCGSTRAQKQQRPSVCRSSRAQTRYVAGPTVSRHERPPALRRTKARMGGTIMDYMRPVSSPVLMPAAQNPLAADVPEIRLDPD